mgnify:CR=1 FL=1
MKKLVYILGVSVFVLISCNKNNDDSQPVPVPAYKAELQTLIENNWADFVDGRQGYPGGYALQILSPVGDYYVAAGDLSTTTNKSHFRAGSTTKTYTAAAIMLLHQQQKLNIEDIITGMIPGTGETYLPNTEEFNIPFKNEITIKLLLQHRAGMFDVINQDIPDSVNQPYAGMRYSSYVEDVLGEPTHTFSITETAGIVAANQLYNSKPGTEFHYSDTGMGLLGLIVERVSGKRFDQFLADNFLTPLGLNNTSYPYEGSDVMIPEPTAGSYAYYQGEVFDVSDHNVSLNVAEGNMITTPYDLSLWIKSLYTGNAGVNYNQVQFYIMDCLPTFESHQHYGLGTVFTPKLGYGHNGGILGYFTIARYDPETDITVVMYTNVWDFDVFEIDFMIQVMNMYSVLYDAKDILLKKD